MLDEAGVQLPTIERIASQAFHWAGIEATKLACLYPATPTPLEWEALKALASARIEHQNAQMKRASEEKPQQQAQTYGREDWQRDSIEHIRRMKRQGK